MKNVGWSQTSYLDRRKSCGFIPLRVKPLGLRVSPFDDSPFFGGTDLEAGNDSPFLSTLDLALLLAFAITASLG